jgi:hypothetical protein
MEEVLNELITIPSYDPEIRKKAMSKESIFIRKKWN